MGKADLRRAEKARAAAQVDERRRVVLRVLQACDETTEVTLAQRAAAGEVASCAAGCTHCCHLEIPVVRAEAETIVAWLAANRTPEAVAAIRDRLRGWLAWYRGDYLRAVAAGASRDDVFFRDGPACVLLEGDRCGAYAVRPVTCRNHYVSTPAAACDPAGPGGPVETIDAVAIATREHVAEIRRVTEAQGGSFLASVHLMPEWLAHLLGVERDPWKGAPALRLG